MGRWNKNNQWHYENHFNMDSATLDRINDKLSITNDAGIEGNQLTRFRGLKIIFNNTIFKFQDKGKDTKEIEAIETQIKNINSKFKESPIYQNTRKLVLQFESMKIDQIEEELDKLEKDLNIMLFRHGIINLKVKKKNYELNEY